MVKLLMRLYDPVEGRVTLDGVDVRDYDVEEYRQRIGTIFQDYRIYAATVEENVWMDATPAYGGARFRAEGDATDGEHMDSMEEVKMNGALRHSGFGDKVTVWKDGMQTQLTREFDEEGVGLSGGESQKLATARVFYKDSDLIILDEPSSALDPIAEYQLNHSMVKAAEDKSVIFISHRLSTTRHADRIFMLENGNIIEEGTHESLLAINGKYAQMWAAQASKYVE